MGLPADLIEQFVKVTNDTSKQKVDTTTFGTTVVKGDNVYVKLDGSELYTPVSTTTHLNDGERVMVTIKNHTAIVTGNMSSPAINLETEVNDGENGSVKIVDLGISMRDGFVEINNLMTENFKAVNATIESLDTKYATIENLNATNAIIDKLDVNYAQVDFANIGEAAIGKIYANIGVIEGITTKDVSVTGKLAAVSIHGDVIEASTIKADKLIVLGDDGLYYKLNVNSLGETTASSDPKYKNGLDGSVIIAESINANKIDVSDLVAFDATIGGFKIEKNAIHSIAKTGTNVGTGIYMTKDGEMSVGDNNNYLKFHKDTPNSYKFSIGIACNETLTSVIEGTDEGLVISNRSVSDLTLDKNILLDSDGVNIRSGDYVLGSLQSTNDTYLDQPMLQIHSAHGIDLDAMYRVSANTFYDNTMGSWGQSLFQCRSHDPYSDSVGGLFRAVGSRRWGVSDVNGDWCEMRIGLGEAYMGVYSGYTLLTPADSDWSTRIHLNKYGDIDVLADTMTLSRNNTKIRGVNMYGDVIEAFQAQNEKGNTVIGWGNYEKEEPTANNQGNTNVYGQDVHIGSAKAGKIYFRPYFRLGDTVNGLWYGAGFISSSATKVYFTIPLAKPVIGDVDVLVESEGGITIRQGGLNVTTNSSGVVTKCTLAGKYCYGSSASQTVAPKSLLGYVSWDGNSIRVVAEMEGTENAINNTPCGITANLKFTFIEKAVG